MARSRDASSTVSVRASQTWTSSASSAIGGERTPGSECSSCATSALRSAMRIALLSDIHGNRWALEAVLEHAGRQRVDETWNLGDILSGPLDVAGTADLLMALDLPTVRGN